MWTSYELIMACIAIMGTVLIPIWYHKRTPMPKIKVRGTLEKREGDLMLNVYLKNKRKTPASYTEVLFFEKETNEKNDFYYSYEHLMVRKQKYDEMTTYRENPHYDIGYKATEDIRMRFRKEDEDDRKYPVEMVLKVAPSNGKAEYYKVTVFENERLKIRKIRVWLKIC
jgi:hypothetical protein